MSLHDIVGRWLSHVRGCFCFHNVPRSSSILPVAISCTRNSQIQHPLWCFLPPTKCWFLEVHIYLVWQFDVTNRRNRGSLLGAVRFTTLLEPMYFGMILSNFTFLIRPHQPIRMKEHRRDKYYWPHDMELQLLDVRDHIIGVVFRHDAASEPYGNWVPKSCR